MNYHALRQLSDLRAAGTLTEEEFQAEKAKLLDGGTSAGPRFWGMSETTYAVVLHLSQLLSFVIPLSGLVIPLVMWAAHKDESRFIADQGRNAANWLLSSIVYLVVILPLCFILIGIPFLVIWGILDILFPIIAAVKAADGITWRYPLSIRFLKDDH